MSSIDASSLFVSKSLTWLTLAIEAVLPFALWMPDTRRAAICLGLGFHLILATAFSLFLFHWLMILLLLTFLDETDGIQLN